MANMKQQRIAKLMINFSFKVSSRRRLLSIKPLSHNNFTNFTDGVRTSIVVPLFRYDLYVLSLLCVALWPCGSVACKIININNKRDGMCITCPCLIAAFFEIRHKRKSNTMRIAVTFYCDRQSSSQSRSQEALTNEIVKIFWFCFHLLFRIARRHWLRERMCMQATRVCARASLIVIVSLIVFILSFVVHLVFDLSFRERKRNFAFRLCIVIASERRRFNS